MDEEKRSKIIQSSQNMNQKRTATQVQNVQQQILQQNCNQLKQQSNLSNNSIKQDQQKNTENPQNVLNNLHPEPIKKTKKEEGVFQATYEGYNDLNDQDIKKYNLC